MLLSAVSVLVVAQSSSEIPEGLMNNPVYLGDRVSSVAQKITTIFWVKLDYTSISFSVDYLISWHLLTAAVVRSSDVGSFWSAFDPTELTCYRRLFQMQVTVPLRTEIKRKLSPGCWYMFTDVSGQPVSPSEDMIDRTSVNNYQHMLRKSEEEQKPHLRCGGSLKSRIWFITERTGRKLYGITMTPYFTDFPFLLIFRILFLFLHSPLLFIECTYTLLLSVSLPSVLVCNEL